MANVNILQKDFNQDSSLVKSNIVTSKINSNKEKKHFKPGSSNKLKKSGGAFKHGKGGVYPINTLIFRLIKVKLLFAIIVKSIIGLSNFFMGI